MSAQTDFDQHAANCIKCRDLNGNPDPTCREGMHLGFILLDEDGVAENQIFAGDIEIAGQG